MPDNELLAELASLIIIPPNLSGLETADNLANSPQLQEWYEKTRKTALVNAIVIDHVARNPVNGKILFLKVSPQLQPMAQNQTPGPEIKWNVFVTGSGPCLCAVFNTSSNAEDHYTAIVRQYRVGAGRISDEIPAGLRSDGMTLQVNALTEFSDETGLVLTADDIQATSCPAAASPSTVSEEVTIFYVLKNITAETLQAMKAISDNHKEREPNSPVVTAEIIPLAEAWQRVRGDMKSSLALSLAVLDLANTAMKNGDTGNAAKFLDIARLG